MGPKSCNVEIMRQVVEPTDESTDRDPNWLDWIDLLQIQQLASRFLSTGQQKLPWSSSTLNPIWLFFKFFYNVSVIKLGRDNNHQSLCSCTISWNNDNKKILWMHIFLPTGNKIIIIISKMPKISINFWKFYNAQSF